jgi:hypothetical protein
LLSQSPSFYQYGSRVAAGNKVAAMPLLHMPWPGWAGSACDRQESWGHYRGPTLSPWALHSFYMGEHYVADLLGGMALASVAWLFTGNVAGRTGSFVRNAPDLVTTLVASAPEDMPLPSRKESARRAP